MKNILLEKFFTWEILKFDVASFLPSVRFHYNEASFEGPTIYKKNIYKNSIVVGQFYIRFEKDDDDRILYHFQVHVEPAPISMHCYLFLDKNSRRSVAAGYTRLHGRYDKIVVNVDLMIESETQRPLSLISSIVAEMKLNPRNIFTIRCGDKTFQVYKQALAEKSEAFAAIINTSYENSTTIEEKVSNSMVIKDFHPIVVEKMVEFCESETIASFDGYECELFKIADKYLMNSLMAFVLPVIFNNTTSVNRLERLSLANLLGLDYLLIYVTEEVL